MSQSRRSLGAWGEALAASTLAERGFRLVERNARTPYGELDLVMRLDGADSAGMTVFVEVKTRMSEAYGLPEASITATKRAHLLGAAEAYLQAHPELGDDWRVDVVAIRAQAGQPPEIIHFENALG